MHYLGLGKTLFNSSACLITRSGARPQIELILSERVNRNKASGVWPEQAIRMLLPRIQGQLKMAENRDVLTPLQYETALNRAFPFEEHLSSQGLQRFSSSSPEMCFVTHHLSHAMAAVAMAPFRKALILVIDGAGTRASDFSSQDEEIQRNPPSPPNAVISALEACSVYLFDGGQLRCARKFWQTFEKSSQTPEHSFSEGLGTLYEKSAEFIFNCKRSAGKVMGLAAFGSPSKIEDRRAFLDQLDWSRGFRGKGKQQWEHCGRFSLFADFAAAVQCHFEESLLELADELRRRHPDYENLIFTGGCALNCTTNMKLLESGLFREIYVPPFPGDESIGLGTASFLYHSDPTNEWKPLPHEEQGGYFGPLSSVPEPKEVESVFSGYEIVRPTSIASYCAERLEKGDILGWYQERSESGPRALGNRSILARPDVPGLKDHLNRSIKFRESFRPYGCSCTHEKTHLYFEVEPGFNSPYMSFAARTRPAFRERLGEVTHHDGTSRMQTVRRGQNALFHELIEEFGKRTGLFCLLNTSLNIMGEPIVETLSDARNFLDNTPVDGMAVGPLFIRKRRA